MTRTPFVQALQILTVDVSGSGVFFLLAHPISPSFLCPRKCPCDPCHWPLGPQEVTGHVCVASQVHCPLLLCVPGMPPIWLRAVVRVPTLDLCGQGGLWVFVQWGTEEGGGHSCPWHEPIGT